MGDQCPDHPNPSPIAIPDQDPQDAQDLVDVKTNNITPNQEQKDNFMQNMIQASQTMLIKISGWTNGVNMAFQEQHIIKLLLKTYLAN